MLEHRAMTWMGQHRHRASDDRWVRAFGSPHWRAVAEWCAHMGSHEVRAVRRDVFVDPASYVLED